MQEDKHNYAIQYPKLSDVAKFAINDEFSLSSNTNIKTTWIRNLISANPEHRGLFAFVYPFSTTLEGFAPILLGCRELKDLVQRFMPSLYVKFLVVKNNAQKASTLESIDFLEVKRPVYQLTFVDERDKLFQDSIKKTQTVNIKLDPNQSLIIPLELGFDRKAQIKFEKAPGLKEASPLQQEEFKNIQNITLHIAKPLSKSAYTAVESRVQYSRDEMKFVVDFASVLTQPTAFSNEFLSKLASTYDSYTNIPRRFAIGSILNVDSFISNGETIRVNPPSNEPSFSIVKGLYEGSCPYISVYDERQKRWVDLGTVIRGRNLKLLKGDESIYLTTSISKVKLEERENETSYIDSIRIIFTNPATQTTEEVAVLDPRLLENDEDYLVLHKGDFFEIDVLNLLPSDAINRAIKVNGYYEVLDQ